MNKTEIKNRQRERVIALIIFVSMMSFVLVANSLGWIDTFNPFDGK